MIQKLLRSVILVLYLLALVGCNPAVSKNHKFSLRLADSKHNPGMTETTMRSSGETVFLDVKDIVTRSDFESIRFSIDERGRPCISLDVNKVAGEKLFKTTSENTGKMIAMVINGVPELAIPIAEPFSASFRITGDDTQAEIEEMYAAITGYD